MKRFTLTSGTSAVLSHLLHLGYHQIEVRGTLDCDCPVDDTVTLKMRDTGTLTGGFSRDWMEELKLWKQTLADDPLADVVITPAPLADSMQPAEGTWAEITADEPAHIKHPREVPDHVLICALGPTRHDLISMQTAHVAPLMDIQEIWGINAGCNTFCGAVAWDMLWVMDYIEGEHGKYPAYVQQVRRWAERWPDSADIITSKAGAFGAFAREYPLAQVLTKIKTATHGHMPYFHNSIPYMLAYAWAIGVKRISLFGVDYDHPGLGNRYEAQRPNAEYWIGFLRGQGVEVHTPDSSTILNSNNAHWFYGYPRGPDRAPRPLPTGGIEWPSVYDPSKLEPNAKKTSD